MALCWQSACSCVFFILILYNIILLYVPQFVYLFVYRWVFNLFFQYFNNINTMSIHISPSFSCANYWVIEYHYMWLYVLCPKLLQSHLCDPMDCSLSGSFVHGTLQATLLEWVVMPFSRRSSQSRDRTHISYVSCAGRQVLYHSHPWEAMCDFIR